MGLAVKKLGAPRHCYALITKVQPWVFMSTILLFCLSLFLCLGVAPSDYQQGEAYRILFIHVPAAALSIGIYSVMSLAVVISLVWKIKLADMFAAVNAPIGAFFTAVTLVTGMLWGKPMWGAYWVWDVRLTSELLLFFIYLSLIVLRASIPDSKVAAKAAGLLTLVGVVNLPIIHYSVQWWHTLHQGSTILQFSKPQIDASMLVPLVVMACAYVAFYSYLVIIRMRAMILTRELNARWVHQLLA